MLAVATDFHIAKATGVLEEQSPLIAGRVVAVAIEEAAVALVGKNIEAFQIAGPVDERRLEIAARSQIADFTIRFPNIKVVQLVAAFVLRVVDAVVVREIADGENGARLRVG